MVGETISLRTIIIMPRLRNQIVDISPYYIKSGKINIQT